MSIEEKRDKVKEILITYNLSELWLRRLLLSIIGINVGKAEMVRILSGALTSPKATKVINASNDILNSYINWEQNKKEETETLKAN